MSHLCFFYILEDDQTFLQWLSAKKEYSKSRINLKSITDISDNPTWKTKINFEKSNTLLAICYRDNNEIERELVLKFQSEEKKLLWWQGNQYFTRVANDKSQTSL